MGFCRSRTGPRGPQNGFRRFARLTSLWTVALVASGCVTAGSIDSGDSRLPGRQELTISSRDYKRVYLTQPGNTDTDRHVGYVAKEILTVRDGEVVITTAMDLTFTPIGFYFDEGGATYKYDADDSKRHLGNHPESDSLELLFGETGIYRFSEELRPRADE